MVFAPLSVVLITAPLYPAVYFTVDGIKVAPRWKTSVQLIGGSIAAFSLVFGFKLIITGRDIAGHVLENAAGTLTFVPGWLVYALLMRRFVKAGD